MDMRVLIMNLSIHVTVEMVIRVLTVKFRLIFAQIYHAKMVARVRMKMVTTTVPVWDLLRERTVKLLYVRERYLIIQQSVYSSLYLTK